MGVSCELWKRVMFLQSHGDDMVAPTRDETICPGVDKHMMIAPRPRSLLMGDVLPDQQTASYLLRNASRCWILARRDPITSASCRRRIIYQAL
jgi:hypothetical protein